LQPIDVIGRGARDLPIAELNVIKLAPLTQDAFRRPFWTAAPAIAALLVYASTLAAGFSYDDESLIRTNPTVHDAALLWQLPFKPLLPPLGAGHTNYYRPVVSVLYGVTWQIAGGRPVAYHALNVLLHMLNATLLLGLIRRVQGEQGFVALGAAMLFAVHPLTSEVVAWPSGLPELGYVAFGLSALCVHLAGRRVGGAVLFGFACGCKETALAFLPVVVLLELWPRRSKLADAARAVVPYVCAAVVFFGVRSAVLGGLIPRGGQGLRTVLESIWNAPQLLLLYAKMLVVPSPLLIQHVVAPVKSPANVVFVAGAVLIAAALAGIMKLRRRRPDLAFAACLTGISLLPALYLPALGRDPFAERYAYLAVAGFCWLLVGGIEDLVSRSTRLYPAWALPALVYVMLVAAAARTALRCGDWNDDGTLGKASIRDEPRAAVGYLLAGDWLQREGRTEEAWRSYRDGLDHVPASVELQRNTITLGVELHHLSHDDVMALCERLVPLSFDNAAAEFNLGHALLDGGRFDAARTALRRALELAPPASGARSALAEELNRLGDAYENAGRPDDARSVRESARAATSSGQLSP
jgi:tetratricopeptide (TPR) repeat protein